MYSTLTIGSYQTGTVNISFDLD